MFLNLTEGVGKLGEGYANTAGYMEAMGVMPALLPLLIFTEIVFAIGLIIGFKTRLSAIFTSRVYAVISAVFSF